MRSIISSLMVPTGSGAASLIAAARATASWSSSGTGRSAAAGGAPDAGCCAAPRVKASAATVTDIIDQIALRMAAILLDGTRIVCDPRAPVPSLRGAPFTRERIRSGDTLSWCGVESLEDAFDGRGPRTLSASWYDMLGYGVPNTSVHFPTPLLEQLN